MSDPKKHGLRVIDGGGDEGTPTRSPRAFVLEARIPDEQQLALPGIVPSRAVISVSPAALFACDLAETLRALGARHIVDIRLAVEFGSLGLDRRDFDSIIGRLGLCYWHCHVLANKNHELSWNPTAMWSRFHEQLQRDPAHATLLQLRDLIDDGPLVLLSESPYHATSERRVVLEALEELRPGFTHHLLDPSPREPMREHDGRDYRD